MKFAKERRIKEIMRGSPVTLKPGDTLDLANDVISLGASVTFPSWTAANSSD